MVQLNGCPVPTDSCSGSRWGRPKLEALFQAIIDSDDGIIFTRHQYEDAFDFSTSDQKVNLHS